jgi:hypothetical protein
MLIQHPVMQAEGKKMKHGDVSDSRGTKFPLPHFPK